MQRQTKAAADADAKLKAALTEQQRLAKAAADSDSKRKSAEGEQEGLKDQIQRLTKAGADTEVKLKAAEAEIGRLTKPKDAGAGFSGFLAGRAAPAFAITTNNEVKGAVLFTRYNVRSIDECQQSCAESAECKRFSYNKKIGWCTAFKDGILAPNDFYDSGVRN